MFPELQNKKKKKPSSLTYMVFLAKTENKPPPTKPENIYECMIKTKRII